MVGACKRARSLVVSRAGGNVLYLLRHHRDAFRVEWLPSLVEMTSLGEGASGHCRNNSVFKSFKLGGCF